jgi:hypothetical protein
MTMTDTIYRADAIEAVAEDLASALNVSKDETRELAEHALSALPSAENSNAKTQNSNQETQKSNGDLIYRAEDRPTVIRSRSLMPTKDFMEWAKRVRETNPNAVVIPCDAEVVSAEAVQGWIPFTRRPMTEEEQKDYPNCTFMFDCVLPDDGDEILVSNRRFVWMDTFCSDIDGCYLDSGDDIDEDMAWMPLPEAYKGGGNE